jgi:hypothetical protein
MGSTKCAGNYSPVLAVQLAAKQGGFADVVYLDAKSDTCLEEVQLQHLCRQGSHTHHAASVWHDPSRRDAALSDPDR